MNLSKIKISAAMFLLLAVVSNSFAQSKPPKVDKKQMAARVKSEFMHAWNDYKKYAWGHDDLKPLSKSYKDWYGQTLLMTPVDALDTLYLLGFKGEADTTRKYITDNLSFDKDIEVQNFEITIRLLGGLLSAYQVTNDKKLLALAEDLGTRLLPVFDSPTGLPYRYVNLKTGKTRGEITNPAETGTLLIEFGTLAKLTNKPVYYDKAKRALIETYNRRSPIGLVGTKINVETGKWTNPDSHISAEIDSYYEYLLKCAILFDDADCRRMWNESIKAIHKYNADERDGALWYGHADMTSGVRGATIYGALDAFFPAILALGGDLERAKKLQDSSFVMWTKHGIEPEEFDYVKMAVGDAGYPLRPEIVESTYYLYQYTSDEKYLRMGSTFFDDFVKYCRNDVGYAALKSVVTKEKSDSMQSFLFAETFKYYYLLFAPAKTLDFKRVVFNTEAHPIKKLGENLSMIFSIQINNRRYQIETENPLDVSIPLDFYGAQPNAYAVERATSTPCEAGAIVGDTRRGGSCNFEQVKFIPHCTGTHTECVGHITNERIFVRDCLRDAFIPATLVTVKPEKARETKENYAIALSENDGLITRNSIENQLKNFDENFLDALILRTLPNDRSKLSKIYLETIPPFFSTEAIRFIRERGVKHLLVDTPSIDRIFDEGKLSNHRIFWNVAPGKFEIGDETLIHNTITELIYALDEIADGNYLLNLQIAPFASDAAPSRPILFKVSAD